MLWTVAFAQDLVLDGELQDPGAPFEFVAFEVPEGVVELQVDHLSLGEGDVLDWGLDSPSGFRGWGGSNAEPIILNADAASRSYLRGPVEAGTWRVSIGKPVLGAGPHPFSLRVSFRDEVTLAPQERQPYVPTPALMDEARWYAGDFHVHSLESGDASADLDAIANLARERGLDFVVVSDHNTSSTTEFLVGVQARHPDVLLIPGQEFTTYDGHGGAIGVTGALPYTVGVEGVTVQAAVDAIHEGGGLFSINHPMLDLGALCRGCAWEHELDPVHVDAVEIQTGGLEPVGGVFTDASIAFWEDRVLRGHDIAAIGGSDDHRAGVDLSSTQSPIGDPTTLVYAQELSVDAILGGVREQRTVVKLQGPGDPFVDLPALEDGQLVTRVEGGQGARVRFVVDGEPGELVAVESDAFVHSTPAVQGAVRAELLVDGERRVVTSHVQLAPPEESEPEPRCGCSASTALDVRWRRRR